MPYQQKSGQYNQLTWFLTDAEIDFLRSNNHLENRVLFKAFNERFECEMTYSRMRHFQAQYQLQKCDKGPAYTAQEKEYVRTHYHEKSCKHMGEALGRTPKSIQKLMSILNLKRSKESENRLRAFRSKSGAASYHAKISRGELEHPASALHDSYIKGVIKRNMDIENVPENLIKLKRIEIQINRELKKLNQNESK